MILTAIWHILTDLKPYTPEGFLESRPVNKEKVLTTFRKGIVLRLPSGYQWQDENNHPEVGDVVAYPRKASIDFDLFKDSQLVNPYNVVAFVKGEKYFKD